MAMEAGRVENISGGWWWLACCGGGIGNSSQIGYIKLYAMVLPHLFSSIHSSVCVPLSTCGLASAIAAGTCPVCRQNRWMDRQKDRQGDTYSTLLFTWKCGKNESKCNLMHKFPMRKLCQTQQDLVQINIHGIVLWIILRLLWLWSCLKG